MRDLSATEIWYALSSLDALSTHKSAYPSAPTNKNYHRCTTIIPTGDQLLNYVMKFFVGSRVFLFQIKVMPSSSTVCAVLNGT